MGYYTAKYAFSLKVHMLGHLLMSSPQFSPDCDIAILKLRMIYVSRVTVGLVIIFQDCIEIWWLCECVSERSGAPGSKTGKCAARWQLQYKGKAYNSSVHANTINYVCIITERERDLKYLYIIISYKKHILFFPDCRFWLVQSLPQRQAPANVLWQSSLCITWNCKRKAISRPRGEQNNLDLHPFSASTCQNTWIKINIKLKHWGFFKLSFLIMCNLQTISSVPWYNTIQLQYTGV